MCRGDDCPQEEDACYGDADDDVNGGHSEEDEYADYDGVGADGDGDEAKPFKTEWATIKDGKLWIGSIGFEWSLR